MRLSLFALAALLTVAGCAPTPALSSADAEVLAEIAGLDTPPEGEASERAAGDDATLPFDPDVRRGTLDNGLTYYVLRNAEPQNRAELRLVVNAGSILEDEDQRGLAHMLEHMAFNGTERFPEQELVQYLESTGMQFGADVNAYTSFDETVYQLQLPTDGDGETFATGLDVLREWAGSVTISEAEVEKERGVVLEEQRLGKGAGERIRDQQFPILFQDSRYATRLPIGTAEVLSTAPAQRLRDFYEDWYRPDLMSVVVVGDVDADAVVAMIESRFADLETPDDAPDREVYGVPDTDGTLFAIATDPELTQSRVSVVFKQAPETTTTIEDLRQGFVESLFGGMMNARFQELTQSEAPPFAAAFAAVGGGVRGKGLAQLIAIIQPAQAASSLDALVTEAERVRQFGFTASELERQKTQLLRGLERQLAEAGTTPSRVYAARLASAFLQGDVVPSVEFAEAQARQLVPGITLDEVNAVVGALLQEDNRVVQVALPEADAVPVPTEDELAAVLSGVAAKRLDPYVDAVSDEPLVAAPPPPGRVTGERELAQGVLEWTLSNGVRVLLKPTDFKADEVLMSATSPGGTSLVDDATFEDTQLVGTLIGASGVGPFDQTALGKKLAGQVASVSPYIGERDEGFRGAASPDDLETLFQLTYLYATAPREDATALASIQQRFGAFLANRSNSPEAAFQDTLTVTLTQDHPRRQPVSMDVVTGADLQASLGLYRDRFADFDDFTFAFVGAFDLDTMRPLVEQYLASLPSLPRTDVPRDVGVRYADGVIKKVVRRGTEEKAQVSLVFTGDVEDYGFTTEAEALAMAEVLSTILREDLREERGGVYGVRVAPSLSREPNPAYSVTISFGADPARVDELIGAVQSGIRDLQANGPEARFVDNVHEAARRSQETRLRDNRAWLSWILESAEYGLPLDETVAQTTLQEAVTAEDIQRAARTFLDLDRYVQVILVPETLTGPVGG